MSSNHHTVTLLGEAGTLALGASMAPLLVPGMRIYLQGNLGAGKTTFTRGLLRALGHKGPVKSPTYALVEIYVISAYILYHFDFYRFNRPEEWRESGLDEHFNERSVCLVEWPEKAAGELPPADIEMRFNVEAGSSEISRTVDVLALSERGERCLDALRTLRPNFPQA